MLGHENGSNFVEWHAMTKYVYSFTKSLVKKNITCFSRGKQTNMQIACYNTDRPNPWGKFAPVLFEPVMREKTTLVRPLPLPSSHIKKPTINLLQSFNSRIAHDLHHIPKDFCPPLQQYWELTRWRTLISPPGYIINFLTACSSLVLSTLQALDSSIFLSSDWTETQLPER